MINTATDRDSRVHIQISCFFLEAVIDGVLFIKMHLGHGEAQKYKCGEEKPWRFACISLSDCAVKHTKQEDGEQPVGGPFDLPLGLSSSMVTMVAGGPPRDSLHSAPAQRRRRRRGIHNQGQ